jgi:cobalamin biosynthesis protein CobT
MSTTSRVAGAVAAGYALGRFKKLRLAILVATAMSSPKFRSAAAGMLQDRLPGGAIAGTLTKEVGGKLINVGKTAATSIVASRIDTLSQSLADRSENLRGSAPGAQAGKSRADEPADDSESEEPTDEYEEEEGEEAEEPTDEYEEEEGEEAEEPTDEYEEEEGEEAEEPTDEYQEEEGEEAEEPTDEYQEQEGEEAEEPTEEYEEPDASGDEEPEEPVTRSPRRRRSASPAGRRRG